jgi:hypothetical protein
MRWTCKSCGAVHDELPLDWQYDAPWYWDGGRAPHDGLTSDLCVWTDDDGRTNYFIRGLLSIPIVDANDALIYGAWSSLSRESHDRVNELWDDPARVDEPPYFGWLSNTIAGYPDTLNIPANVVTSELEWRPQIVLDPDFDHPLVQEQREGISLDRAKDIAELFMHRLEKSAKG